MISNYNEALVKPFFDYFKAKGLNDNGICGLLGNIYAESKLYPNNLQNNGNRALGMTDEEYTKAVDNGTYTQFVDNKYGYGLCQWTSKGRKAGLYNLAKSEGVSIGNAKMQFEWLYTELSRSYKSVLNELCSKDNSVSSCARIVMLKFERPANQSEANQMVRVGYAQDFYDLYVKGEETITYSREKFMDAMRSFRGAEGNNAKHKEIVALYNSYLPHPRGHVLTMNDPWCAATVSAAAIKAKYTAIIPIECSCTKMIEIAKSMGIWQERDDYVPDVADLVLYDWEDDGKGDCTGTPNHIGAVEHINSDGTQNIIEGNYNGKCQKRNIAINGRYIRGYICPKYGTEPIQKTYTVKKGDSLYKIGKMYGVPWQEIAKANNIAAPYTIYPGQVLIIP